MTKGTITFLRLLAVVVFVSTAIVAIISPDVAQLIAVDSIGLALFAASFLY
jgi:hypothetical protein